MDLEVLPEVSGFCVSGSVKGPWGRVGTDTTLTFLSPYLPEACELLPGFNQKNRRYSRYFKKKRLNIRDWKIPQTSEVNSIMKKIAMKDIYEG